MFSTTIELIQHSPLLHFKWEQDGLLRMTELRPKLNRFILDELQAVDPALYQQYKDVIKNHFKAAPNGNGHIAPYKLWVTGEVGAKYLVHTNTPKGNDQIKGPHFADLEYANASENERQQDELTCKKGIVYKGIKVHIKSWNQDLIKLVKDSLKILLTFENFGARQSKGFGSFTLKDQEYTSDRIEEYLKKHPKIQASYSYTFLKDKENPDKEFWRIILEKIEEGWKKIRAGNPGKGFKTSLLYIFFSNGNLENHSPKQLSYTRMLLGFASDGEYKKNDETEVSATFKKRILEPPPERDEAANRLRSPLTFKIINNTLYFLLWEVDEFSFEPNGLPLRNSKEFDYIGFFKKDSVLKEIKNLPNNSKYKKIK